jgi:hypothetical protein
MALPPRAEALPLELVEWVAHTPVIHNMGMGMGMDMDMDMGMGMDMDMDMDMDVYIISP